jgi:hypothetical protein
MKHPNRPAALIVATVASFLVGALWYSPVLFGEAYLALRGLAAGAAARPSPSVWEIVGECARGLVVASVLARLVSRTGVVGWRASARLGLLVWAGFQAMMLFGAVLHEGLSFGLYAIHAGDALVKTLIMAVILGAWPARGARSTT